VRINEIALVLGERRGRGTELAEDPVVRQATRTWLDANFDALATRIAPYGGALAKAYANGLCTTADADALQASFAERLHQRDGGPRALAQAVEGVRLCAALQARHQGSNWQLP
jgi:alanyl aminopeptidase